MSTSCPGPRAWSSHGSWPAWSPGKWESYIYTFCAHISPHCRSDPYTAIVTDSGYAVGLQAHVHYCTYTTKSGMLMCAQKYTLYLEHTGRKALYLGGGAREALSSSFSAPRLAFRPTTAFPECLLLPQSSIQPTLTRLTLLKLYKILSMHVC